MALSPTFTVCLKNQGTEFVFTDNTGLYNASTNPGGWGSPNDDGVDIQFAIFRITTPEGNEYVYDYNITTLIPDSVPGEMQFPPFKGDWSDGIYKFEYILTTQEISYSSCLKKFLSPQIDCCIDKILIKFVDDFNCDDCYDNEEITSLMYFRDALHVAALTKNEKQIKKSLEFLQDLCNCLK